MAPPYDEQGESSGQASLLTIPTHPLSLPPIATRVARMTRETFEAVFTNLDWLTLQVTKLRRNLYGDHEQCEDLDFDEGGSRDE